VSPAEIVDWAEAQDATGVRDAMGQPFTSWLLARYQPDGRALRDAHGRQVFETQAEFKARRVNDLETLVSSGEIIKCNGAAWGVTCPRRSDCAHHKAHQTASIGDRGRDYNINDSRHGWTLLACKALDQCEAFSPMQPAPDQPAGRAEPTKGQNLELFV
jgi:hypothetical protein